MIPMNAAIVAATTRDIRKMINRIPHEFVEVRGAGESSHEQHAGSYHMALHEAGISDFNIITYSSVLPKDAVLVDAEALRDIPFGSELMCIMGVCNGRESELLTAGVVYAWLYDDEDEKIGGLACEVSGNYSIEEVEWRLQAAIEDLHERTYDQYRLGDLKMLTKTITPQVRYGTALAALCFVSFRE